MAVAPRHQAQDKDSTLYIGGLDERCTDALVWELLLQAGPIINVHLPKDRVTQMHQGYGFVEFGSEEDADYAAKIMNQIRVWGKPIRVNKASADRRVGGVEGGPAGAQGVGADLFVGNLDPGVDEKVLFETFSRFGPLLSPPKVAREDNGLSKGYGFISYADFEASDDAIANMHGQFLGGRECSVQYAYKKDGKGERHGDVAERALAREGKKHGVSVAIPAMPAGLVTPIAPPISMAGGVNGMPLGVGMMNNGYANGGLGPAYANGGGGGRTPQPPPSYNYAPYAPPPQQYAPPPPQQYAPQQHAYSPQAPSFPPPPARNFNASPLQPPPSAAGLPARPPPSMAGYGGPPIPAQGMPYGAPPPGFAPPPQGFQPPPPPMGFPGFAPPPLQQGYRPPPPPPGPPGGQR